ncbi:hypothetical protein [Microbacterium sp.]|uniref:hypothetical protein n=1 Tax=Microbacterium sp. TaxID=51671 RepID=UPI0039E6C8C5
MDAVPVPPTLTALASARRLLAEAATDAADLSRTATAIAAATDWRSRAADGFRGASARLRDELDALDRLIALSDGDLAARQCAEVSAMVERWS